jgi:cell filamentation protein
VTFDPFGDFATEGYLRNFEKEKDPAIVKRVENASFMTGLDEAFAHLADSRVLTYGDVLKTHGILFGAIYPWAGQDRSQTTPKLTIKKGTVIFADAPEIRPAVEFALRKGQEETYMKGQARRDYGLSCLWASIPRRERPDHHDGAFRACPTRGLQHRLVSDEERRLS